jgi:sugar phosphate permease
VEYVFPVSTAETQSAFKIKGQGTIYLMGFGHASTHWVHAMMLFLFPYIQKDFGLTYTQIGLLSMAMHISALACNFGSGPLVDMTGRRIVFLMLSLLGTGVALFCFGFVQSFIMIFFLVALVGAANNLWHAPGIAFLSEMFPKNRGYVLAVHATGANLGDAASPFVAGILLLWMSWQTASMGMAVPVFIALGIIAFTLMPREPTRQIGSDGRGLSLRDYATGLAAIARVAPIRNLTLVIAVRGMAQVGIVLFVPLYLVNVLEFSPEGQGTTMMLMQIGGMAASMIAGTLSDRIGRRPVVFSGLTATTIAIIGITFISNDILFIVGVSVLGFVLFAVRPVMQGWMMDLTPRNLGGSATSVMFGVQALFGAAVPVLGGIVADTWGLLEVFYMLAGFMLIANVLMFTLRGSDADPAAKDAA